MKLTPASRAARMIRIESSWSGLPQAPNIIAPRHSGLTWMPVRPSVRCSMARQPTGVTGAGPRCLIPRRGGGGPGRAGRAPPAGASSPAAAARATAERREPEPGEHAGREQEGGAYRDEHARRAVLVAPGGRLDHVAGADVGRHERGCEQRDADDRGERAAHARPSRADADRRPLPAKAITAAAASRTSPVAPRPFHQALTAP